MTIPEQQVVRDIEAEIAKQPIDVQHRIKNMASAIREFVMAHAGEGHMALAYIGAKLAAEEL